MHDNIEFLQSCSSKSYNFNKYRINMIMFI